MKGINNITVWSSTGRIEEAENMRQALKLARRWATEYDQQKITASWIEKDEQINEVLFNGENEEKAEEFLRMIRISRGLVI